VRAHSLERRIDTNNCANDEDGQLSHRHASRHARMFIDEGSMLASYFFDGKEGAYDTTETITKMDPPKTQLGKSSSSPIS
jgi:hypothetical protein